MNYDIHELFEHAKNDSTLKNTICIEELLEKIDGEYCYLSETTLDKITEEVVESFTDLKIYSNEFIQKCCKSLLEYQYIDAVHKFKNGRLLRWLRIHPHEPDENKVKLKSGALCTGVKFHNNGTYVQCVSANGKYFFQLKYDDHIFYQKLSPEEQMILGVMSFLQDKTDMET